MKKKTISILILTCLLVGTTSNFAIAVPNVEKEISNSISNSTLIDVQNLRVTSGSGGNFDSQLDNVKNLKEGTITTRFDLKSDSIQSLIGVSDNTVGNNHFHLWTNGVKVGYEIRENGKDVKRTINATLNKGVNTVAFKVEENVGYSLFVNGEKVDFIASSTTKFLNDIPKLNSLNIGKTDRVSGFEYPLTGDIDFLSFTSDVLTDDYLLKETGETKKEVLPLPEGAYLSETQKIFDSGDLNSKNFRIPSILTTSNGTVIAATDVRNNHAWDAPANIDAGVRLSKDGGKTWGESKRVIDYPGYASVIDSSLLEDKEAGKVFLFITAFPENGGGGHSLKGTGFEIFENENCMILFDGEGRSGQDGKENKYYIKPDGKVYDSSGNLTSYSVDTFNNLYENGVKVSNIFLANSPLKAYRTSYLTIIESSDDGETWSNPKIMSGQVKKDWMKFLGAGPGVGIQIENGEHVGRLVFPLYYTNEHNFQSSAVMYSDDHGVTWNLGESPNDTRDGHSQNSDTISSGNQLTECQVVEMPNGQLKMFMRNTGSYVRIATSFDGGETWDSDVYEDRNLIEPYCQLSVINYNGLIDGKEALIFTNPNAGDRSNGTTRIGLIEENGLHENGETKYDFNWKYSQTVVPGYLGYSSITQLPNNNIGLFYEGVDSLCMNFVEMNLDYIKADLSEGAMPANLKEVSILNEKNLYKAGDKLTLNLEFDMSVSLIGNKKFTTNFNEEVVEFNILSNEDGKNVVLECLIPDVSANNYNISLNSNDNLDIINIFGQKVDLSNGIETNLFVKVGSEINGERPNRPSKLNKTQITDSSVVIEWTEPSNTPIKEYIIYKDGKEITRTDNKIYEVLNLKPNNLYNIKVVAVGENEQISKPASLNIRTEK